MTPSYFSNLSAALHRAGIASPVLVVDKTILDQNISCLKETLEKGYDYRVVAKSLPSIPFIEYILSATQSNRLMCFHLPFLIHLAEHRWSSEMDYLLGKPMPVMALKAFYQWFEEKRELLEIVPEKQVQWLIDSLQRLDEYETYAIESGHKLRVNLEIDVGLHRGGYSNERDFRECLKRIAESEYLELSGLMGYDMQVSKASVIPGGARLASLAVKKTYERYIALIDEVMGQHDDLCFNAGGSPTYSLYEGQEVRNELSIASGLVKPSDFDIPTLSRHKPAAFIATPILKTVEQPKLPLASIFSPIMRGLKALPNKAAFIYGGNWLADPCYPKGTKHVKLYGHSSNQEMYSIPDANDVNQNDFIFFRPRQSEAVFLQFGRIAVYQDGEIVDWWSVFDADKIPRWIQESKIS